MHQPQHSMRLREALEGRALDACPRRTGPHQNMVLGWRCATLALGHHTSSLHRLSCDFPTREEPSVFLCPVFSDCLSFHWLA